MTEKTWHLIAKRYSEDIAQETAILLYVQYPPVENERHWCARVARRLAAGEHRRMPRDPSGDRYQHAAASLEQLIEQGFQLGLPAEQERLAIARELLSHVTTRLAQSACPPDPLAAFTDRATTQRVRRWRARLRSELREKGML